MLRDQNSVVPADLAGVERSALRDGCINTEVWLVARRLLDIDLARTSALNPVINNRTRQLLMHIDILTTICGRANGRLRIYGS